MALFTGGLTLEWIVFFFALGLFLIAGGWTSFYFIQKARWPFEWRTIENVAGMGWIPTKRGRCRMIGFGDGGEEIFYLKGLNKWRAAYGKRIGNNQILWVVGDDGYWYNSTFGDFDKSLLQIGVMPVDKDMRYAYASIRKGIEKRYDDRTFMDKWGTTITLGMLILAIIAMGVSGYYVADKVTDAVAQGAENSKINAEVMELANKVLSNIAKINSEVNGGSGLVPA